MIIGILGGSFDPPHNGHLHVAKMLLKQKLCQKVIFMPCFKHPFDKQLSKADHRLIMTKLLEKNNTKVSDIEIKRGRISYSIDTLNALRNQSPKDKLVWILGEDQIESFKKWKAWREIIEQFGLIVVPRQARPPRGSPPVTPEVTEGLLGGEITNRYLKGVAFAHFKPLNISSSEIRKRIKEGLKIDGLVPKEVERYIIKHKLYSI